MGTVRAPGFLAAALLKTIGQGAGRGGQPPGPYIAGPGAGKGAVFWGLLLAETLSHNFLASPAAGGFR